MRTEITINNWDGTQDIIPAIVRGDLALNVALRKDGRRLNEWSVSYVPTGQQVIVVEGAHAGRVAFRELQKVSFVAIDNKLMRRCNKVVKALRKRGLKVLHPRTHFGVIVRPALLDAGAVGDL